ncbi:sulfatase-like hydrolase/transferase [Algisphaera agarilytica]|uniref:Arylsulfatase A-like enzyme n=1 Tax=Algisphaera agarilytica TaxID=1385975 RepID=A0A7X0H4A6_9BACT|nr:sulfatase-like hydrolase/transferase [Algisphaera agarilytica]MBB6428818.1 arylsulfatase A-like enzyme [Algisphaera agarilytica]
MNHKRNLLIVLAHGLRSDALSDEREWPLPTPHLVDLAERGVRLVLSSASPADPGGMTSVLTGLHARQHGQLRDDEQPQPLRDGLPAWLADAGYHTVGVGEVGAFASLLDESLVTEGVANPEPKPNRCWYTAAARSRGHAPALAQQRRQRLRSGPLAPDRLMLEPEEDIDGFIAAQAAEALGRMPEDKPWAMFVVFSGPGNELPPPMYYDGLVEGADLAKGFVPAKFEQLDALVEPELPRSVLQRLEPHQVARIRADYLGRVSLIDHGVGRFNEALSKRKDADRTWTVLTSDRGQLLGEHGLIGHRSFLAPSIEVPLIVTPPDAPGVSPPKEKFQDGLFSVVDVAPTIAHLGGADHPESVAGRSVLPIFNAEPVLPVPPANLSEFHDRLLVETERHKAVFRTGDRKCLGLFDLLEDPEEKVNLIHDNTATTRKLVLQMRLHLSGVLMPLRG